MSEQTANLAAVIESSQAPISIVSRQIPTASDNKIVVHNHAVAGNPVDWKIQAYGIFVEKYPMIIGSDICGTVTSVGPSVTHFQVGDRVSGFAGSLYSAEVDQGAFQTYTLISENAVSKIPVDMSFVQGSVFPMGFATAAEALFIELGVSRPARLGDKVPEAKEAGVLVWGAASSVGSSMVQIANNLGFKVFATASPRNHKDIKGLGATAVFDYRDANVQDKLVEAARSAGMPLKFGFDAISEDKTFESTANAVKASGGPGSKLANVLPWPENVPKPEGVELSMTAALKLLTAHREVGAWFFNEWLEEAMKMKAVVPAPMPEVVEGGIRGTQKLFDTLKQGVSNKKLVIVVE